MPHSERANETRRALYREGRLLGLSPRDAGHLYSARGLDRARARDVDAPQVVMPSQRDRQRSFRDYVNLGSTNPLSPRYGKERKEPVDLARSEEIYRTHNSARVETKANLVVENDAGERRKRSVTLLSDRPLTRGEARDQIARFVEKGNLRPKGDTERATLVGAEFLEILLYPTVSF